MEQNNQEKNNAKIKLDAEGEPMIYNSKKYLGKKIVILVLFLLILAIAGYIYFSFFGNKDENQLLLEQNAEILKDKEAAETEVDKNLDTDSDGLPDYLEKILGTALDNPDIDGDGYSDFEEIKNGYSPLTSEKYTDEEWDVVKEKIRGEDEGLFGEMFGVVDNNINTPKTEAGDFVCGATTVSDVDNNIYNTVKIGEQCWLKENLKVTKNPAGIAITRYCYHNNPAICETDGGLYDWNTAMDNSTTEGAQGICPNGWHVPKDSEWYVLENYLTDDGQTCDSVRSGQWDCATAGIKLRSSESKGFEGILAGIHNTDNSFVSRGTGTYLWSSSKSDTDAWFRGLGLDISTVLRAAGNKLPGYSVHCLKD